MSANGRGPSGGPERLMRTKHPRLTAMVAAVLVGLALALVLSGCAAPTVRHEGAGTAAAAEKSEARTVTLPYRAYGMARVVGDALYVSVDSGQGRIDTLLRYELTSGQSRILLNAPTDISWVAVNERWLLWEADKTLYAEPVGGGDRQVLATGREAFGPALEADWVAWVDNSEDSGSRIIVQNLRTTERREVARTHLAEFYNNFMQLRDGRLLWTDIYDGNGHYLLHDLATGQTQEFPMPATRFRYPGYAVRSGDSVFSVNFDRFDQWDWNAQQLGRYSLGARAFTPVNGGDSVNALVAGRDAIAVIDSRQRLWVGPADGTYPRKDVSSALGGSVDAIQISSDGVTAVAGRSQAERGKTTFLVFALD